MDKREAKNEVKLNAIVRKLKEEERSEEFPFPLRLEEDNDRLENCLSKPRFTTKLVCLFISKYFPLLVNSLIQFPS